MEENRNGRKRLNWSNHFVGIVFRLSSQAKCAEIDGGAFNPLKDQKRNIIQNTKGGSTGPFSGLQSYTSMKDNVEFYLFIYFFCTPSQTVALRGCHVKKTFRLLETKKHLDVYDYGCFFFLFVSTPSMATAPS